MPGIGCAQKGTDCHVTSVATLTTSSWRRRSLRTCVCCAGFAMTGRGYVRESRKSQKVSLRGAQRRGNPFRGGIRHEAPDIRHEALGDRGTGMRTIPVLHRRGGACPARFGRSHIRGNGRGKPLPYVINAGFAPPVCGARKTLRAYADPCVFRPLHKLPSANALPQSHSRASLKRFSPPMARLRKLRLCFFCPRQRKTAVLPAAG